MTVNNVTVFCASSNRCDKFYLDEAEKLGEFLAKSGRTIFYGGGKVGLMGRLAGGSLKYNGKVIGIITEQLKNLELGNTEIAELRIVGTMHEREEALIMNADCIVALPGGCGTIEELMQAITWKRLGIIQTPVIIVNLRNFYDPLVKMLELTVKEKFMKEEYLDHWIVVNSIEECMNTIENMRLKNQNTIDIQNPPFLT
ncbi:MAG: TIGR00730 family Rossman fold protein [Candidatus Kapabacteria bacterium]|nr:TIGR00730 family Rossman fold protein [Candidatus Kapabacteria bacterium]